MTVASGDKLIYHAGGEQGAVEATVTSLNDDGTINITYPHPANPDVAATAEHCQWGAADYQLSLPDGSLPETVPAAEPPAAPTSDLQAALDEAKVLLDEARSTAAGAVAKADELAGQLEGAVTADVHQTLQEAHAAALAEIESLKAELAKLTAPKAAKAKKTDETAGPQITMPHPGVKGRVSA